MSSTAESARLRLAAREISCYTDGVNARKEITTMEIRTQRLLLRPITMDDLATTHTYVSDLENTRYMMYLPSESVEETAQGIAESIAEWRKALPSRLEFAMVLDGAHIGGVMIFIQEDRTQAELGWVLHRDHWGHGYTTEAAAALADYARRCLGVKRLFACCDSENTASFRVMEKLGMRRVSATPGRRNRSMPDERIELVYEVVYQEHE